jgi:hypothetical protein
MDTGKQERGKQSKQTPGDVGTTTKTKQTKFDLTAVRHLLLEGLVRSLLPVRGATTRESPCCIARGPIKAGVVLSFSSDP